MSVTTSTKSFRDLTRRQAVELCYVLEEQRDKALAERDALAAKLARVEAVHARYFDLDGTPGDDDTCPAPEDVWRYDRDLRTALDASETP